ncbi:MAG: carbamoyltransferase N-terminal domain-containing protein [Candidatus Margulisiibacteriota bacterium]
MNKKPLVLGISAFFHDSAAVLVEDGEIISAVQEERFTRTKFDSSFPVNAINFCFEQRGVGAAEIDTIAFYDEPQLKLDRLIETLTAFAPLRVKANAGKVRDFLARKYFLEEIIATKLPAFKGEIFVSRHHLSHAASAFYPSPFEKAAIIVVDAMGEWSCSSIGLGEGAKIELLKEQRFPHSVGLLYSAFTQFLGFKVNSGEYKVMGLAPYGTPKYANLIKDKLVEINDDGSIKLNTEYFDFMTGRRMISRNFQRLFNAPERRPEGPLTERDADVASSIQKVVEEIMGKIVRQAVRLTGQKKVAMAGGVALNCVVNGKLLKSDIVEDLWIQPAAGDAGGALGAALLAHYNLFGRERKADGKNDSQKGSFLGPAFSGETIKKILDLHGFVYDEVGESELPARLCNLIAGGKVIGIFQGKMEFGPRALGARSIIGDARDPDMQKKMNLKIKYRESFRPFAPVVLAEEAAEWFEIKTESPYMLITAQVAAAKLVPGYDNDRSGIGSINKVRSIIPAVTHVDCSARVQTVDRQRGPYLHRLLEAFKGKTGCPVMVNTSFNVRGEPIVGAPIDALRCFMNTEMDYLVLERFILDKQKQKKQLIESEFKAGLSFD